MIDITADQPIEDDEYDERSDDCECHEVPCIDYDCKCKYCHNLYDLDTKRWRPYKAGEQ